MVKNPVLERKEGWASVLGVARRLVDHRGSGW